jgi:thiamine pyrophosphokinase
MISGNESVRLLQGNLALDNAAVGDRISLLPISLFCTVSTCGLKYPLASEKLFRGQGRGISNVVIGLPASVTVESGVLAVVCAATGRREQ